MVPRLIRTLPIGMKKVFIQLEVKRIECRKCFCLKQVKVGFADEKKGYSKQRERFAIELSKKMSTQDVAKYLEMCWDTIKEIHKKYLENNYSKPILKHLETIAIDEIAIGSGHKYLTVVMDMTTGAIVFAATAKVARPLNRFGND